jgi:hypothetical protein
MHLLVASCRLLFLNLSSSTLCNSRITASFQLFKSATMIPHANAHDAASTLPMAPTHHPLRLAPSPHQRFAPMLSAIKHLECGCNCGGDLPLRSAPACSPRTVHGSRHPTSLHLNTTPDNPLQLQSTKRLRNRGRMRRGIRVEGPPRPKMYRTSRAGMVAYLDTIDRIEGTWACINGHM